MIALALLLTACDSSSNPHPTQPAVSPETSVATPTAIGTGRQRLTFPALPTIRIGQSNPLSAHSDAGLPVTYDAGPRDVCTMIINAPEAQAHGAGICRVTATQVGNATYAPARPVTRRFRIVRIPQTVRLRAPSALVVGESGLVVSSASSELGVIFVLTGTTPAGDPVCRLDKRTLVALAAGTCTVTATQPGDYQWAPARPRTRAVTVHEEGPVGR